MTPLHHWFSAQCNHFSCFGLPPARNGTEVAFGTVMASPATIPTLVGKGRTCRKGIAAGSLHGTPDSFSDLGRTLPVCSILAPRWRALPAGILCFSLPLLRVRQSLPPHSQSTTRRPISSWVSGSLDMLSRIVRRVAVPSCGGRMKTSQTSEAGLLSLLGPLE